MNVRVGLGYDVHKLESDKDFWLGGIKIEHSKGSVGHSDADTLIHAVCDALLGAAGLRDIGYHFPPSDITYKNIDSKILLAHVVCLLESKRFKIGNIDATVVLELPKIQKYIPTMEETLAKVMHINKSQFSIKATTTEKLGFEGREEGLSVHCVALIYQE